jgi:hypothetical protein
VLFTNIDMVIFVIFELPFILRSRIPDYNKNTVPEIYKEQKAKDMLTLRRQADWLCLALWNSAVAFFVPAFGFKYIKDSDGKDYDMYSLFLCCMTILVYNHDIQMLFFTKNLTVIVQVGYAINFFSFFPLTMIINNNISSAN